MDCNNKTTTFAPKLKTQKSSNMKKVLLSLAIVAIAFSANAQDKKEAVKPLTFSVGALVGIPVSPSGAKGTYFGGDVQGEYAVSPELGVTLAAGYLNRSYKGNSSGAVPVLAGVRYYFSDHKVYGAAAAGLTFSTTSGGGSMFTYAPSVGYYITPQIDASVRYQGSSKNGYNSGLVALRVAYNF